MPRRIKTWACEFRCGRGTTTHKKDMEAHELRCKKNPNAHACPTCRHEVYEPGQQPDYVLGDMGYDGGWYCTEEHLPEGRQMKVNCKYWEEKEEQHETV